MSDVTPGTAKPFSPTQLILLALSAACLFAGQLAIRSPVTTGTGPEAVVPNLGGIVLILLAFSETIGGRLPGRLGRWAAIGGAASRPAAQHPLLLIAALVASTTAAAISGDDPALRLPWLSIGLWVAGIALVLVAAGATGRGAGRLPRAEFVALILIASAAGAARLVRLENIPWVLSGDEGSVGLSAREFLEGGWNNPFRVAWYSFPSLFFLLPAASIALFGQTIEALRLPAAIAGTLTVIAVFLYARSAFGSRMALLSAAYLAFFHFHIHFSRIALNNIWDALFLTVFSYLLWRAWSEERRSLFVWAGLVLGLGLYFYTSTRILVVLLPVWVAFAFLQDRARLARLRSHWLLLAVAALVIALPLAWFFAHHPDEFLAPMERVSVFGPWLEHEVLVTGIPAWKIVAHQMALSAGAFTFNNLRHWYAIDHPMLLPVAATLFLLGLGISLWRALDLRYTWLLLCLGGVILVGGLSESAPASQRYILAAPIVALLVVLPLAEAVGRLPQPTNRRRRLVALGAIAVLLAAIVSDLQFYFVDYTPSRRFSDRNTELAQDLGLHLRSSGLEAASARVYFFGEDRMNHNSISSLPYLAPGTTFVDVHDPVPSQPTWDVSTPTAFVFLPGNTADLARVQEAYPGGTVTVRRAVSGDELYTIYTLPW